MQNDSQEKKTKAEIAVEKLEELIVACDIAPGSVMTETEISEMLDIGRTPVREALMRLANENLVRLSRGGVVIPELNPMTMLKLLEPRSLIEQLCIEKAIERMLDEDKQNIAEIIDDLETLLPNNRQGFMTVLRKIHHTLAQTSKNEFILASIKSTQALSRRFWCYYADDADQVYSTDLYIREMKALLKQDNKAALAASSELIRYLQDFAKKQMEQFH